MPDQLRNQSPSVPQCGGASSGTQPVPVHTDMVEMVLDHARLGYACPVPGCNGFLSNELRAILNGTLKADPQRTAFFSGLDSDEITQEEFLKKHGPRDA